jgi:hypothetical protein
MKPVLGVHLRDGKTECADGGNNSKRFRGDVSGHRFTVLSFNSTSKSGDDVKRTDPFSLREAAQECDRYLMGSTSLP